jgi:hypothetical protein
LITALTEGGNPKSLPGLETDLKHRVEPTGILQDGQRSAAKQFGDQQGHP